LGKVGGAVVLILGAVILTFGAGGAEYTQNQWKDCHDPEFLEDFRYQCFNAPLNVLLMWSLVLSGAVLMVLGGWVVIDPKRKRWEPPGNLVT
jgi:hypothetical protein